MTISREELIKMRVDFVKDMNSFIKRKGDENLWSIWIAEGVPDCANDEDFLFFAEDDEEWSDLCGLFGRLVGCKALIKLVNKFLIKLLRLTKYTEIKKS